MTNTEILERAITKAIDGGWKGEIQHGDTGTWVVFGRTHALINGVMLFDPVYRHDFARSLFGEYAAPRFDTHDFPKTCKELGYDFWSDVPSRKLKCSKCGIGLRVYPEPKCELLESNKGWQYHLQNMVISEDPIKYLGEHLPD